MDEDVLEVKHVCIKCVYFESLKALVLKQNYLSRCDYCGECGQSIKQNTLFEYMYERTFDVLNHTSMLSPMEHAMVYEGGSDDPRIFPLWEFFQDACDVVCEDLAEEYMGWLAHDKNIDTEEHYYLDDGSLEENDFVTQWKKFVGGIKHQHRFFNKHAKDFLDSLFSVLGQPGKLNNDVLRVIDKSMPLYRARVTKDLKGAYSIQENPVRELGPTPNKLASNQRMTPEGVSAMYLALDRNTCLSEIRPIVGEIAISAEFRPITNITVLDLDALSTLQRNILDELDVNYRKHSHAHEFLHTLIREISRPVGRNESLGYLSTQVFFEYLRVLFGGQIHGILFPSSQRGGHGENIALFPESSLIGDKDHKQDDDPFSESLAQLYFVSGSLIFHEIKAINVLETSHKNLVSLHK